MILSRFAALSVSLTQKVSLFQVAGGTEILSIVDIAFVAEDARIGYPAMRGMTTPDTLYFPWCDPLLHGSLSLGAHAFGA